MSKITNNGLTRSGTRCFIAVLYSYGNGGHQRVNSILGQKDVDEKDVDP